MRSRKRVFEVAILALAEAVPRHVDVASEVALVGIERRDGAAFLGREELRQDGAAVVVELARERLPIVGGHARSADVAAEAEVEERVSCLVSSDQFALARCP